MTKIPLSSIANKKSGEAATSTLNPEPNEGKAKKHIFADVLSC